MFFFIPAAATTTMLLLPLLLLLLLLLLFTMFLLLLLLLLLTTAGLSQVNVEPLQIVSYGPGQQFTLHHDAGTLLEDGSIPAMVAPRRLVTLFVVSN
jgi:hypothetical protein